MATAVGYTGGKTANPTYRQVCGGYTGHAEAVLIEYNPARTSYAALLKKLWSMHDAAGPQHPAYQYRSAVFAFDPQQAEIATEVRDGLRKQGRRIDSLIVPASRFWMAEEYHQQYEEKVLGAACPVPDP